MKEQSPLSSVLKSNFPGKKFLSADIRVAGRKLAQLGEAAAVEYLSPRQRDSVPNFRPPAFCTVVAKSRPFEEWPIYKASVLLQEQIYGMTGQEFEERCGSIPTSLSGLRQWASSVGLGAAMEGLHVQGMNLMVKNAINRYKGVLVKVENRNKKLVEANEAKNSSREERGLPPLRPPELGSAFGPDGRLVNPPGIDKSIRLYQGVSPVPVVKTTGRPTVHRLDIPAGEKGHVPLWQREAGLVKEGPRRRRMWYSNSNLKRSRKDRSAEASEARKADSVVVRVSVKEDWVDIDVRGLLRNVAWRGIERAGESTEDLLSLFSGDPVVDPSRDSVVFLYKEGVVDVLSKKVVGAGKSRKQLEKMVSEGPVALVSCDLGQTNYVAARVSVLDESLSPVRSFRVDPREFPSADGSQGVVGSLDRIRADSDRLEAKLLSEAEASLPEPVRAEIEFLRSERPSAVAGRLCLKLGIDPRSIPWEKMGSTTSFISEALSAKGSPLALHDGAPIKDSRFAHAARGRLSPESRKALNEALWERKSSSREYGVISRRKSEASRRMANAVLSESRRLTGLAVVAVNLEDLNMVSKFFHGRGKRAPGWAGFFTPKMENRWFIRSIHKAMCDLSKHRGITVIESRPERTSISCPECGHCDPENRSGERFSCKSCGVSLHADFEVATRNLERVALTGKPMPRRENLHSPEGATASRKTRKKPREATASTFLDLRSVLSSAENEGSGPAARAG